ncbi:MAG: DUF2497 domain-containing protein [Hyphomicrobiaceae bacterium]|nr:DUF2497 domain-containing protein [Hyphomicrobiaceae bacterium]
MEEILASIRKIISEEPSSGAPSRPRPSDRPAPVLPSRVTPPPAKSGEREAEGRNFADSASQRPVGNVTGQRVEPAFGSSKQSNTPPLSGSQGGDQLLGRLSEALGRNVPSPTLRKTPLAETPNVDGTDAGQADAHKSDIGPAEHGSDRGADLDELADILAEAVQDKSDLGDRVSADDADEGQTSAADGASSPEVAALDSSDAADVSIPDFDLDETSKPKPLGMFGDDETNAAAKAFGGTQGDDRPAHKSANALAFDRMLTARMGTPKDDATEPGESDTGSDPFAMRDNRAASAPADGLSSRSTGSSFPSTHETPTDRQFIPAAQQDAKPDVLKDQDDQGEGVTNAVADADFDDNETSAAAKSAFGALMAGLAASAEPVADERTADPASEKQSTDSSRQEPHISKVADNGDSVADEQTSNSARATLKGEKVAAAEAPFGSAPASVEVSKVEVSKVEVRRDVPAPHRPKVVVADVTIGFDRDALQPKPVQHTGAEQNGRDTSNAEGNPPAASAAAAPAHAAAASEQTQMQGTVPQLAQVQGLAATLGASGGANGAGVRTVEDIVADLLRPMLRDWLAQNMPRMVEKALRIELAEGLKTINPPATAKPKSATSNGPSE